MLEHTFFGRYSVTFTFHQCQSHRFSQLFFSSLLRFFCQFFFCRCIFKRMTKFFLLHLMLKTKSSSEYCLQKNLCVCVCTKREGKTEKMFALRNSFYQRKEEETKKKIKWKRNIYTLLTPKWNFPRFVCSLALVRGFIKNTIRAARLCARTNECEFPQIYWVSSVQSERRLC